jgi:RNA polymerase sigma-70 factor, ECF subfamily
MPKPPIGDTAGTRPRSRARSVTSRTPLHPSTSTGEPVDGYGPLVVAAAAGDAVAMERLLVLAQEVAYRFSVAICGHAEDAEDAMQEALIQTYRRASTLRDPGAFRPWLYRTVRNACLMNRRRRVHEPRHLLSLDAGPADGTSARALDVPAPDRDPEGLAVNAGLRSRLLAAMQHLPPMSRAVLFLREMEGLSTREVAKVLSLTEANVKQRLHRARARLQRELADV